MRGRRGRESAYIRVAREPTRSAECSSRLDDHLAAYVVLRRGKLPTILKAARVCAYTREETATDVKCSERPPLTRR